MKILHFADLHLGVENYGRLDTQTGISSRLLDFLAVFDQVVDYALDNQVDLVLFCGDAYKSREPSQTQQREFARRISRLATNGVCVFLLVGNHDQPSAIGKATSTEIFDTLAVKNVHVSTRPEVVKIATRSGIVQVASLPWLRRSTFLTREDSRTLSFEEITQKMEQVLTGVVEHNASQIDPALPAVLAAHVWVTGAQVGTEKLMSGGHEHALLPGNLANPVFDYVALGHVHKRQVLHEGPPVVYSGSLERVDFSEENDDKGFYLIDIEPDAVSGKRQVSFEFHPVSGRRFLTISVNIEGTDPEPTSTVLKAISGNKDRLKDAIVRLQISFPAELGAQLKDNEIKDALREVYFFTIARDPKRETRLRLGGRAVEEISPLEALKTYLESSKSLNPDQTKSLLDYGERLINDARESK